MRIFIFVCVTGLLLCASSCSDQGVSGGKPDPIVETAYAFQGAEGFGRDATGGRGGKVIFVTNLNDSGAGSLRSAVQETGARYVVFTVSGTIVLKSALNIDNSNITIAGQTAPGDGICLRDYPVSINADNVIIRFIRFRMGDAASQEGDALGGRLHKNIIVDHCSMSWSTDECVSFYANVNTTIQWCIIAESLRNSVHSKGAHGYGGIWGGRNASFHHNLLAHHDSRNPRFGEEAGKGFALTDFVDVRNNVIYNWGSNSAYGGEAMNINIVNNYFKPGPATIAANSTSRQGRIYSIDKNKVQGSAVYDTWGKYYINGNYVDGHTDASEDNWTYGVLNQFHASYTTYTAICRDAANQVVTCEYSIPVTDEDKAGMKMVKWFDFNSNVTTHNATQAYDRVLEYAGASLVRDAVDQRVVENVKNKSYSFQGSKGSLYGIIDSQSDVGGWPELVSVAVPKDTDNDGMPDEWETQMKLNPRKYDANGHDLSTGYENIEVYLNNLVGFIVELQIK